MCILSFVSTIRRRDLKRVAQNRKMRGNIYFYRAEKHDKHYSVIQLRIKADIFLSKHYNCFKWVSMLITLPGCNVRPEFPLLQHILVKHGLAYVWILYLTRFINDHATKILLCIEIIFRKYPVCCFCFVKFYLASFIILYIVWILYFHFMNDKNMNAKTIFVHSLDMTDHVFHYLWSGQ